MLDFLDLVLRESCRVSNGLLKVGLPGIYPTYVGTLEHAYDKGTSIKRNTHFSPLDLSDPFGQQYSRRCLDNSTFINHGKILQTASAEFQA